MIPRQLLTAPLTYMNNDIRAPQPYMVLPDGSIRFSLYNPNTSSVQLQVLGGEIHNLTLKKENDLWTGICKPESGLLGVIVIVDGNGVLCSALPMHNELLMCRRIFCKKIHTLVLGRIRGLGITSFQWD